MGPVRTITEFLLAPAIAITGRSDQPATLQPGAPASRDLRGLGWFLGLGLAGLAVLLTGVIWDASLHARNPDLAHQEGLFTLSNPGHLLLFAGLVTVAVGMVGATWTRLGLTTDPRRSFLARCLLLFSVVYLATVSVLVLNRAASAELAAHGHGADHVHASGGHEGASAGQIHASGGHEEASAGAPHAAGSCQPTPAQRGAATRLVADTRRGAARFVDLRDARTAGYAPHVLALESVKHYFNPDYVTDGRVLDPGRPEGLLYAHTTGGPVLVAAVYLMNTAGEPGRAVVSCLTQWHAHENHCSSDPAKGLIDGVRRRGGRCPPGQVPWATPPMLHTWLIDLPQGPFAAHVGVRAVFDQLHANPRPSSR
jgi:hypothetical protein